MRSYPNYCRGSITPMDGPLLICKFCPSLGDTIGFEEKSPLASTVKTWRSRYPTLKISYIYRETAGFDLDRYIHFAYSNPAKTLTVNDYAKAVKGDSDWLLAKVFVESFDRITLLYFHIPTEGPNQPVDQLLVSFREVPYIRLVIAKSFADSQIAQRYYEISMHGRYDDAVSGINAIKRLHCGQPIGTIDLSHVTRISSIKADGKLSARKYIGLVGENAEEASLRMLSLEAN